MISKMRAPEAAPRIAVCPTRPSCFTGWYRSSTAAMKEKNFPGSSWFDKIRPPTHQIAAESPTAAITSMSGEENARTAAMWRSNLRRRRFASANRADSHASVQKDWITRMPATDSRAISEM